MINFLISRNNTNSQSTEQQCDEKKENHQTRGYHLIEHHILKDIFMTLVWQTVKRIDFNILEVKGLVPLRQPMVLFLPKLFLNWSLLVPIDFVTWYVFTVDHPDITITDWHVMHEFYQKARYGEVWSFPYSMLDAWNTVVGGKSVVSYSPVFFY